MQAERDEVGEARLTAAMRAFEQHSTVLRYREAEKWHLCDVMGMQAALKAGDAFRPATPGGDATLTAAADDRFRRLLIAFHDATRRPLGVTPASGDEFYDWRLAEAAEERRPRHGSEEERRERPEVRLVAAQREKAAAMGLLDGHASVVRQLERERDRLRAENDRLRAKLEEAPVDATPSNTEHDHHG